MKIYIFLVVFCISAYFGYAQAPVIDYNWLPSAGDKYYEYKLYGDTVVNPNDTGSNITWDFHQAFKVESFAIDSFDFALPAERSITCINPASNLVSGFPGICFCFIKNSNDLLLTELYSPSIDSIFGNFHEIYIHPEIFTKGAFHFRQVYHDTSTYYYYNNNDTADSVTQRGISIYTRKYDGYGTLKIAGHEYDTAVRIHITRNQHDTTHTFNDSTYLFYDDYEWYTPSIHVPLLRIQKTFHIRQTHASRDTLDITEWYRLTGPAVTQGGNAPPVPGGVQNATAKFDGSYLKINGIANQSIYYALFDAQGKLIQQGSPVFAGHATWQVPANISQGVYILRLRNDLGDFKSIKVLKDK